MEQSQSERLAVVENRLDGHDRLLDSHSVKIDEMAAHDVKQDVQLEKLCRSQEKTQELAEKNTKILEEIRTKAKTTQWLVASIVTGVPALIAFWAEMKGFFS